MKYSKQPSFLGLGRLERERLSKLLRETQVTISVAEAAKIWRLRHIQAAKILAWYHKKGWLKRVSRGIYIAVPLTSESNDVVPEEPFVVAQ